MSIIKKILGIKDEQLLISELENKLKADPEDYKTRKKLYDIYRKLGRLEEAENLYQKQNVIEEDISDESTKIAYSSTAKEVNEIKPLQILSEEEVKRERESFLSEKVEVTHQEEVVESKPSEKIIEEIPLVDLTKEVTHQEEVVESKPSEKIIEEIPLVDLTKEVTHQEEVVESKPSKLMEKEEDLSQIKNMSEKEIKLFIKNNVDKWIEDFEFNKAILWLKNAINFFPNDLILHEKLKDIYKIIHQEKDALVELLIMADIAIKNENWATAKGYLDEGLKIDADNRLFALRLKEIYKRFADVGGVIKTLFIIGKSAFLSKEYDIAYHSLKELISIEPEDELSLKILYKLTKDKNIEEAVSYLFRLYEINIKVNKIEKAKEYIEEIILLQPENIEAHKKLKDIFILYNDFPNIIKELFTLGDLLEKDNKFSEALYFFNEILKLKFEEKEAHQKLKDIYTKLQNTEKVIDELFILSKISSEEERENYLKEIILLDEKNLKAYLELKAIYEKDKNIKNLEEILFKLVNLAEGENNWSLTKEYLTELRTLRPDDNEIIEKLINCNINLNDIDSAYQDSMNLSNFYISKSLFDKAETLLNKIFEYTPDRYELILALKSIYEQKGDKLRAANFLINYADRFVPIEDSEKLISIFKEVITLDPQNDNAFEKLRDIFLNLKDTKRAVLELESLLNIVKTSMPDKVESILREILKLSPENENAHEALKDLFIKNGEIEKGVLELLTLSDIAIKNEDIKKGVTYLEEIIKIDFENEEAYEKLADLYKKLDEIEKAINSYLTLAKLTYNRGDYYVTLSYLEKAYLLKPDKEIQTKILVILLLLGDDKKRILKEGIEVVDYLIEGERDKEALEYLRKLNEIFPQLVEIHERLLKVNIRLNNIDEISNEVLFLYRNARNSGNLEQAESYLREGLKYDHENIGLQEELISLYLSLEKKEEVLPMLFNLAEFYLKEGNLENAKEKLLKMLELSPRNSDAIRGLKSVYLLSGEKEKASSLLIELGEDFFRNGQVEEAEKFFKEVIEEIDPLNVNALISLSNIALLNNDANKGLDYLNTILNIARENQDTSLEENILKKILEISPEDIENFIKLKEFYVKRGDKESILYYLRILANKSKDLDVAETYWNEFLEYDKNSLEPHIALCNIYKAKNDIFSLKYKYIEIAEIHLQEERYKEAERIIKEALTLDPQDKALIQKLKEVYIKSGKFSDPSLCLEIKDYYLKIDDLKSAVSELIGWVGIYKEITSKDNIEKLLREAVKIVPERIEIRNILKEFFLENGMIEEAISELSELSKLAIKNEQTDKAELFLREILQLAPESMKARNDLKDFYIKFGENDKALVALLNWAEESFDNGDYIETRRYLEDIFEIDDKNMEARKILRDIYLKENDLDSALKEMFQWVSIYKDLNNLDNAERVLNEILQLSPTNEEAKNLLNEILIQTGKIKEKIEKEDLKEELIIETPKIELEEEKKEYLFEQKIEEPILEVKQNIYEEVGLSIEESELEKELEKITEKFDYEGTEKPLETPPPQEETFLEDANLMEEIGIKETDIDLIVEEEPKEQILEEPKEQILEEPILSATTEEIPAIEEEGVIFDEEFEELPINWEEEQTEDTTSLGEIDIWGTDFKDEKPSLTLPVFDEANVDKLFDSIFPPYKDQSLEDKLKECDYYESIGQYESAKSIYHLLLKDDPENTHVQERLRNLSNKLETSNIDEMFIEFQRSLPKEMMKDDPEYHYRLGVAYREMNLFDDAIAEFTAALKGESRKAECYFMLGGCYADQGLYDEAIDIYEAALVDCTLPRNYLLEINYNLGELYEEKNLFKKAYQKYKAVDQLESNYRGVKEKIAHLEEKGFDLEEDEEE